MASHTSDLRPYTLQCGYFSDTCHTLVPDGVCRLVRCLPKQAQSVFFRAADVRASPAMNVEVLLAAPAEEAGPLGFLNKASLVLERALPRAATVEQAGLARDRSLTVGGGMVIFKSQNCTK